MHLPNSNTRFILTRTDFRPNQMTEATNLIDVRNLQLQWQQQGKQLNALDATDISQLYAFEYLTGKAAAQARQMLAFNDVLSYREPVSMPPPVPQARLAYDTEPADEMLFDVYPNPAKDYITINYDVIETTEPLALAVLDATGRLVQTLQLKGAANQVIIETNGIAAGTYHCNLVAGGTVLQTQKVSIVN